MKNELVLNKLAKMFGEFECGKNLNDEALIDKLLAWLETELTDQSKCDIFRVLLKLNHWLYRPPVLWRIMDIGRLCSRTNFPVYAD